MIDLSPETVPNVAQIWAQANVPSISQPTQDWIGTDLKDRRFIQNWMQKRSQTEEIYQPRYAENGPLQMPTLKFNMEVDYAPRSNGAGKIVPNEQMVNFGRLACILMDFVQGKAGAWGPECKITQFLQRPVGKLVPDTQPGALAGAQMYFPSRAGIHTARFILENGAGRKVDVTVKIRARLEMPGGHYDDPNATTLLADLGADDYAAWQRSATLSALIASAQHSLTGFTDLPSTALGQTTGEGSAATITLDQNAAGHNWYIDPTPLDNSDDYLPTSDPTVWQAKAGSAAVGKMDMLSVLLHEYGHALGLEHSANGADFMAASLQPGVRKLPSAAELTLMSQLVAELKNADGEALTLALSQGEREQDNPSSPLPSPSPLSALGLLPFGFMRRNGGKGSANAGVAMGAASHIDYLTAINTTLTNGSFSAGQNGTIDQWESVGNVAAAPAAASQTVMLGESTTAQAHLGQAFVLSAQDRFLTFTVSGLDLQTNSIEQNGVFTAAPQDAFEVALQNANTGANLLANGVGGVGNYPF